MSAASLRGAELLGMSLHPHQIALGDLLDQGFETNAVCWPRRAGKTEAVWAWLLGKLDTTPGFQVVITAQTGVKSRDRFMSHARILDRTYPEDMGGPKIRRGAVVDMDFQNGSRLWSVAPDEDAFRGDAANVILFDESQSYSLQQSLALKQGAAPLLDTVLDGQIILAGTPGNSRDGWFWEALEAGRAGVPNFGLSEYAASDEDDIEDEEVWQRVHPGIGTLTTLDKMRTRRATMPGPVWAQEYLGIWPLSAISRAIDYEKWKACAGDFQIRPSRFALAFDVHPDGSSAAIVAAWRSPDGLAHVEVVDHRLGSGWVSKAVYDLLIKLKVECWYDAIGANIETAEVLTRQAKVKARIKPVAKKEVGAGQASFVRAIHDTKVRHPDQPGLNEAVEGAQWRESPESGRYFGWKASESDISPLRAAAEALWAYDQKPEKAPLKIQVSTT